MPNFSPAVLTSRRAQKDLFNIKAKHADIVTGMTLQKQRVDFDAQQKEQSKQAQEQNQRTMQYDMKKTQMANDTTVQKNTMDYGVKMADLDIKRAALSQP